MNILVVMERVTEVIKVVPDVLALYNDLKDGQLDSDENLTKIIDFVNSKSELMQKYVAPCEVLLLVTGVLGVLHEGDTSDMYLNLVKKLEEQN